MTVARMVPMVVLLLAACARKADERPPIAVRVEAASAVPRIATARYSGIIAAEKQVDLSFRSAGYVASLASVPAIAPGPSAEQGIAAEKAVPNSARRVRRVMRSLQAGDRVSAGTVLASLRLADFKHRMSELSGTRAESSANHRKGRLDLERAKALLAEGAISQAEYDATKARHDALAGGASAAAARVEQAGLTLADAELKVPFDGVLLDRKIELGSLVAPGVPAFVLADTSTVKVTFGVPDNVQPHLALGQEVDLTTEAQPDRTFSGVVTKIGAQADPRTRVFEIEATFDNAEGLLKVGMVTQVQVGKLGVEPPAKRILLPLSAIVRLPTHERGFWTYVVTDGKSGPVAAARPVELGSLVGNRVAVTRGLEIGERVVVQGATLLVEGQRVEIVPGGVAYSARAGRE